MVESIPPFPPTVRKISDGESVQASEANKGPEDLTQRTDHLKSRVDAAQIGEILTLLNQEVEESVEVGNIVFRNTTDQKFSKALGGLRELPDSTTGVIEVADSSFSWGIVTSKTTSTLGDILLAGILPSGFDLSNTIADDTDALGNFEPGAYFLSSEIAGKATKRPTISGLYQFFLSDDGSAYVLPSPHGILEDHIHRAIKLTAEPAGLANCVESVDDIHEITVPNSDLPGWLPADDPVFGTAAPVGAKFGYNVAKDPLLSEIFPATPLEGTFLQKNGITVSDNDVIIDNSGIWWTRDDFGNVPWPVDIEICGTSLSSSSVLNETEVDLVLFLTEFITKTDKTVVTKLSLSEGEQSIQLLNPDGTPNTFGTGPIVIGLNFNLIQQPGDDEAGALVVKEVTDNVLKRGPVVERITSGPTGLVSVASTLPDGQGEVTLDLVNLPNTPEDTTSLRITTNVPPNTVLMLAGELSYGDGSQFINVAASDVTGAFVGVSALGKTRFDLVVFNVEQFIATGTNFLEIVTDGVPGEVPTAGANPFDDSPTPPLGKLPLSIIRIDELAGTVDIVAGDITNLKTINHQVNIAATADLRQDGLASDGSPDAAGSATEDGASRKFALAQHSHKANVGATVPLAPAGAGSPGTSAVYARVDHRHPALQSPLARPVGLFIDLAAGTGGFAEPSKCIIRAGLAATLQDTAVGTAPTILIEEQISSDIELDISKAGGAPVIGGLDTGAGAEAADTWYFIYEIADSSGTNPVDVILSASPISPVSLPSGYDVFRKLGSVRNDSGSDFVPGSNQEGLTLYSLPQVFNTADPGTLFAAFDLSTLIPPTSRRGYFNFLLETEIILFTIIAASTPDRITIGSAVGGIEVSRCGGSVGFGHPDQNLTRFFMDVDSLQKLALRRSGSALTGFDDIRHEVMGYTERL